MNYSVATIYFSGCVLFSKLIYAAAAAASGIASSQEQPIISD